MQLNKRVLPPPAGSTQTISPNGRTYSATPGSVLDVLDIDANIMLANGWVCGIPSGPTTSRPKTRFSEPYNVGPGFLFVDTTLAAVIIWDGATWRNVITGAAV
jgi:hypothetical protein